MDADALTAAAAARTEELPGAQLTHPFGPDWDVYKVRGKVFMLITEITGEPMATVKSDPADSRALREAYDDISPGYHMNKKHWITMTGGGRLDGQMVADLVTESYLLVVEKLPRAQRPVDPVTFGQDGSSEQDAANG